MSRKFYFSCLIAVAIFMAGHLVSFAQTAPVGGTIEVKKADGTQEPVAGALIEVYRTDIKTGFPSAKSDGKGRFGFAGLALGEYTFAVSAPNCAPMIFPNVKPGMEKLLIVLKPGDGKKFTETEARSIKSVKTVDEGPREPSDEEKKAKADYEKKAAEIEEKNSKAQKTNEIITAVNQDGKAAMDAKKYDLAISKYEEGIAAAPDFLGSAPLFNNNRAIALRIRAVENRNIAIKLTDTAKFEGLEKTKKDLAASAAGYLLTWTMLKNAPATEMGDRAAYESNKSNALIGAQETFRIAVLTDQVDPSLMEAAKILTPEYIAVESDAVKKAAANLLIADLYRVSGDFQNAVNTYKKVLETNPGNLEAMWGGGNCLIAMGVIANNDKALLQEGVDMLQKFVATAPDTNKYKAETAATIEELKKEHNVAPQKGGGKKKP